MNPTPLRIRGTLDVALYQNQTWLLTFRPHDSHFLLFLTDGDVIDVADKKLLFKDSVVQKSYFLALTNQLFTSVERSHFYDDHPFMYCLVGNDPKATFSAFTHHIDVTYELNNEHKFIHHNDQTITASELLSSEEFKNDEYLKKIVKHNSQWA